MIVETYTRRAVAAVVADIYNKYSEAYAILNVLMRTHNLHRRNTQLLEATDTAAGDHALRLLLLLVSSLSLLRNKTSREECVPDRSRIRPVSSPWHPLSRSCRSSIVSMA